MKKEIKSYFYEVWFSSGKKFWNYDLHEVIKFIRANKKENVSCVLMWRCDYKNSVIIPLLSIHKLTF